jgi:hypothetical protein
MKPCAFVQPKPGEQDDASLSTEVIAFRVHCQERLPGSSPIHSTAQEWEKGRARILLCRQAAVSEPLNARTS